MSAEANEVQGQTNGAANGASAPKKVKTEVTQVQMENGTVQEFTPKRLMNKDHTIDEATGTVTLHLGFRNGVVRDIVLPPTLITKFAAHGAEQKYGDELAGIVKPGEVVDMDDVVLTIDELNKNIQQGVWSTRGAGDGMGGTSVLIKALMEYGGKPLEVVKAFLSDKDAKFKAALRMDDKHKNKAGLTMSEIVKKIELEKASKGAKVDTAGALSALDAMEAATQAAA
jgi:hypothetical protein